MVLAKFVSLAAGDLFFKILFAVACGSSSLTWPPAGVSVATFLNSFDVRPWTSTVFDNSCITNPGLPYSCAA